MAKRKAKKKTTHHRRRRVSGMGSGFGHEAMEVVGLVVGNIGSVIMQKQMTSMNPKIVSGGQLVGGFLLKKHAKSPLMSGIAYGLMSAGAIGLTHEVGIIHGVEEFVSGMMGATYEEEIETSNMRGIRNSDTVSGVRNSDTVTGMNTQYDYVSGMM